MRRRACVLSPMNINYAHDRHNNKMHMILKGAVLILLIVHLFYSRYIVILLTGFTSIASYFVSAMWKSSVTVSNSSRHTVIYSVGYGFIFLSVLVLFIWHFD